MKTKKTLIGTRLRGLQRRLDVSPHFLLVQQPRLPLEHAVEIPAAPHLAGHEKDVEHRRQDFELYCVS